MKLYRARKELLKESSVLLAEKSIERAEVVERENGRASPSLVSTSSAKSHRFVNQTLLRTLTQLSESNLELTRQLDQLREEAAINKSAVEDQLSKLSLELKAREGAKREVIYEGSGSYPSASLSADRRKAKASLLGIGSGVCEPGEESHVVGDRTKKKDKLRYAAQQERLRQKRCVGSIYDCMK